MHLVTWKSFVILVSGVPVGGNGQSIGWRGVSNAEEGSGVERKLKKFFKVLS